MNAAQFYRPLPRIIINSLSNPGGIFDEFNTVIEWDNNNVLGNSANLISTGACYGLRIYAEIRKNDAYNEKDNIVLKLAREPAISTAAAGVTQLIVAATYVAKGDIDKAALPLSFGVGDICVTYNILKKKAEQKKKKQKETGVTYIVEQKKPSVVARIVTTAELWFAVGLSAGHSIEAQITFVAAAAVATTRNVLFPSEQLEHSRLSHVLKPIVSFGLLAAGCAVVASESNLRVAVSCIGFGAAYLVIPFFEVGGLYEAAGGLRQAVGRFFQQRKTSKTPTLK